MADSAVSWSDKVLGLAVHGFTSLGAVFGLLALTAASDNAFTQSFIWLAAALLVDGVDGSLARWANVSATLPRFSGQDLDHIIDYLNYVVVPAFIVAKADVVPIQFSVIAASSIAVSSLYHFSDLKSKSEDGQYFFGFPAIWNVVVFGIFALGLSKYAALATIAICAALTFVPLRFVHPFRIKRLRTLSVALVMLAGIASASCLSHGFPARQWETVVIAISALYLVFLGGLGPRGKPLLQSSYSR